MSRFNSSILITALFLTLSSSCTAKSDRSRSNPQALPYKSIHEVPRSILLETPKGGQLRTLLALTPSEQVQGLSGVKPSDFADDQAMLFLNLEPAARQFWMPDTYFDLDIYFLDKDLKVLEVDRGVKHHPTRNTPPEIPVTRRIYSYHVLEIKSSSPLAKTIEKGDTLIWKSLPSASSGPTLLDVLGFLEKFKPESYSD